MAINVKKIQRDKRKERTKRKVRLVSRKPVLTVFRSNAHVYAQIVDKGGHVLLASSTLSLSRKNKNVSGNREGAILLGKEIARLALEKNIDAISFNRGASLYHGVIKALADSAREAGLQF